MPTGLIGPLENLSAYRNQEGDGPSPVNFMHVQMKVAGRPVNILSRIGAAAPDHTGRTNKIAHHVLVSPSDFVVGGPAAVLRQPGFTVDAWDRVVRKIPEGKSIPTVDSPPRVAQTWAAQAGDAGWAGYVASIFDSQPPGLPVYLLHRPEQNAVLLEMIDEAICILPESIRWNATFSTYTGELPPGVTCRLRCVMAGSPEAAARPAAAMMIDLTSSTLGAPPPERYVDAARAGILLPIESTTASPASTALDLSSVPATTGIDIDDLFELAPAAPLPPRGRSTPPPPISSSNRSKTKTGLYVAAAAAFLCLLFGGAAIVYLLRNHSSEMLAESSESAGITVAPASTPANEPVPNEKQPAAPKVVASEAVVTTPEVLSSEAVDAEPKGNQTEQQLSPEELKQLADQILQDGVIFEADNDQSIDTFKYDAERAVETLIASEEQLKEMQLDDSEISGLVRNDDWEKSLDKLLDDKRKEITEPSKAVIDVLNERYNTLQESLQRLEGSVKKWQDATQDRTDIHTSTPRYKEVEIIISNVQPANQTDLESNLKDVQGLSKSLSAQAEENVNALSVLASTEIKKQRSLHRLEIRFDGDLNRPHEKLQITLRCYIALDPESISFNQITMGGDKAFQFSVSSETKMLPGKYDWLSITGDKSGPGVALQISPQLIGDDIPSLGQLNILVTQQDKTIDTGKRIYNSFKSNPSVLAGMIGNVESEIGRKNDIKSDLEQAGNDPKNDEKIAKVLAELKILDARKEHLGKFQKIINGQTNPTPEKDNEDPYVKQATDAIAMFETLRSNPKLPPKANPRLSEHIANIRTLMVSYLKLKGDLKLFDLKEKLTLENSPGKRSISEIGQPAPKPLETFEMFFIPELVYGPPSD